MHSYNGTADLGPRSSWNDPIDIRLEPETVRWVRAYTAASPADLDATMGAIFDEANRLLHESRMYQAGQHKAAYEARLRVLTEQMPAILWSTDADLRVVSITGGGLAKVSAMPASSMIKPLSELLGTDDLSEPALAAHMRALRGSSEIYEYHVRGRTYSVHVEPLRGPTGTIDGTVGAAFDLTERKRAEQALERREAQLAEAQRLAQVGSWEWQAGDEAAGWSDELYRIWGVDRQTFRPRLHEVRALVHPDDLPIFDASVAAVRGGAGSCECDHRIIRPSGEVRYLHALITATVDAAANSVRLYGTCQDVTERKWAEAERSLQREQQARLDGMLFAVRRLADDVTSNLATTSGAIGRLRPELPLPDDIRETIGAAKAGLAEATKAIGEVQRLIRPARVGRSVARGSDGVDRR
jgi:PAS domain-containing protein